MGRHAQTWRSLAVAAITFSLVACGSERPAIQPTALVEVNVDLGQGMRAAAAEPDLGGFWVLSAITWERPFRAELAHVLPDGEVDHRYVVSRDVREWGGGHVVVTGTAVFAAWGRQLVRLDKQSRTFKAEEVPPGATCWSAPGEGDLAHRIVALDVAGDRVAVAALGECGFKWTTSNSFGEWHGEKQAGVVTSLETTLAVSNETWAMTGVATDSHARTGAAVQADKVIALNDARAVTKGRSGSIFALSSQGSVSKIEEGRVVGSPGAVDVRDGKVWLGAGAVGVTKSALNGTTATLFVSRLELESGINKTWSVPLQTITDSRPGSRGKAASGRLLAVDPSIESVVMAGNEVAVFTSAGPGWAYPSLWIS